MDRMKTQEINRPANAHGRICDRLSEKTLDERNIRSDCKMPMDISRNTQPQEEILCSSPVTEDVPPRRDRSIHGVPPSVIGLVHSRSISLHPTSVNGLVYSPSVYSVNTPHTYAYACMRTQLAISS